MGEHLYSEIIGALPAHIAVLDRSGRILITNRAWEIFAAQNGAAQDAAVTVGANYLQVCRRASERHDEYAARALHGIEAVLSGRSQSFAMDYPCHSPHEQRWFSMTVMGFTGSGEVGAVVSHSNITEPTIAVKEAGHRAKNLLGLVQAIAWQTMKVSPVEFSNFSDRLRSLARVQDLLVDRNLRDVSLAELVRSELAHFSDLIGHRIILDGPVLLVRPRAAQVIGMALHELGTNAAKYGALANDTGRITVKWNVGSDGREDRFTLGWLERGGPTMTPPTHRGFGSYIIADTIELALNAKVTLRYDEGGLS
jgi:two-component sensor histidine kinase